MWSAQPFLMTIRMDTIASLYENYIKGHTVTTDSRNVNPGDIFIALKGENFNGNTFARTALKKGAAAAFVDEHEYAGEKGCIKVDNGLIFLQEIARYHRKQLGIPILGITGTNGKTTTKELCNAVLSTHFKTYATQGNFNNHIGVPLTLLGMDASIEFGIVEMGANHPDEIKTLCDIADPDFGIITNIGRAHLEGFGSYENIIATKKQLYDHIRQKNGTIFVNADDALLMQLSEGMNRHTYGEEGNYLKGEIKQSIPYLVYSLKTLKGDLYIKTRLIGGYNFANAMAASCAGHYFKIEPTCIQKAIENYLPANLRSQLIKTTKNIVILDAYNANPSSMKAALSNFIELKADHKIVILGEMLELGKDSPSAHQDIVRLAESGNFNRILLVGSEFEHFDNNLTSIRHFANTDALIAYLQKENLQSSCILVKGSRGNKLERIVEYL